LLKGLRNVSWLPRTLVRDLCEGYVRTSYVIFSDCPPLDFLLVPGDEGTCREVDNPSGKSYGMKYQVPQTPEHVRKMA
jgi:hypothetical protein